MEHVLKNSGQSTKKGANIDSKTFNKYIKTKSGCDFVFLAVVGFCGQNEFLSAPGAIDSDAVTPLMEPGGVIGCLWIPFGLVLIFLLELLVLMSENNRKAGAFTNHEFEI